MKALLVFAVLTVACYAAPNGPITKGEMPLALDTFDKGNEAVQEERGEVWIPLWGYVSDILAGKPNEIKNRRDEPITRQRPQQHDFDTSEEYLMAANKFHFGSSEEEELPEVKGGEHRFMPFKHPEHVRDAVLYNKVMPVREQYNDYNDFLEETHKHMFDFKAPKKTKGVKSSWDSWFGKWF